MGRFTSIVASFAALAFLVVAGIGCTPCSSMMIPRDVVVTVDNSLRNPDGSLKSVQVDIIAVNASEVETWKAMPPKDYWSGASGLAKAPDKLVMTFNSTENVPSKTLADTDAHWKLWQAKQAIELVVISDIPASLKVITLDQCWWDNVSEPIKIDVRADGVVILTQHRTEKKK